MTNEKDELTEPDEQIKAWIKLLSILKSEQFSDRERLAFYDYIDSQRIEDILSDLETIRY